MPYISFFFSLFSLLFSFFFFHVIFLFFIFSSFSLFIYLFTFWSRQNGVSTAAFEAITKRSEFAFATVC